MPSKNSPGKKKPSDFNVGFTFTRSSAADSVADYSKIANIISTYINQRSSKIIIIAQIAAREFLNLRFLVRIPEGTGSAGVIKTLRNHLQSYASVSKESIKLSILPCDSDEKQRLDMSEFTKIEWKFPGASFQAATLASGDTQPQSKVRAFSPRNATEASSWCWAPAPAVVLGSCTSAKADSGENVRVTAAGTFPFLFLVVRAANLCYFRQC